MKLNIAIIGATGIVGRTVLKILEERNIYEVNYFLFASKKSKGKIIKLFNKKIKVLELTEGIYNYNFQFVLFCTNEQISKKYIKCLVKKGSKIIDFSSFYRHKNPLIVPEINRDLINNNNILCNPNCSTIAGVMALYPIYKAYGLKRIIYSTYQAVSGAGRNALLDMKITDDKKLKKLDYIINDNLIPCIGEIYKNGYSKEENKMIYETKKILNDYDINITATCVRVPISICHSESIYFETQKNTSVKKLKETLNKFKGLKYCDNLPMPKDVRGQNDVFVGRLRKDLDIKNGFNMFVVSDNLRKGAAQNGVQILECLIKGFYL